MMPTRLSALRMQGILLQQGAGEWHGIGSSPGHPVHGSLPAPGSPHGAHQGALCQHALAAQLITVMEPHPVLAVVRKLSRGPITCPLHAVTLICLLQACRVLEDGHQFVLWPAGQQDRLSVGGQQCVIDPYGKGCLHTAAEVSATDALLPTTACLGSVCASKTRSTSGPHQRCSTDQINL